MAPGVAEIDDGRTITAAEVSAWFKRGRGPWPSIHSCAEVAAGLTKMRWGSDHPLSELGEPFNAEPWWDPEKAAAAARSLLDDVPAMLWHWRRLRETPYETIDGRRPKRLRGGHKAIEQLQDALNAAIDYVEFPFGQYERQDHRKRKRPKPWHAPAVLVTSLIVAALKKAGHTGATDKNSAAVRIVHHALSRMGYGKIKEPTIAAFLKSWLAAAPGRIFR